MNSIQPQKSMKQYKLEESKNGSPNDQRRDQISGQFLNNNNITTIEDKAFNDLTKLEKLELHENKIATIRNTTFVGLTNLNQLNILNNPFDCDCKLQGLIDFVKSGSVTLAGNPRCLTPENLKGTPLVSLSAANLTCPDITTMPTTIHETESETIDATTEFMKTTYETMPNCSPLQKGNSLVVTHLYLCLFVKTMIEL
ncbi:slit homolog 1 protein-like [Saccostrea cucullata]|uniref:slit homolog 1 protein-like n=1 Tax=Saccostrea cuccullata TaxID=36930 RepID=UPI002ED2FFF9